MPSAHNKTSLIVIRHSPYGSSLAKAGVDLALAAGAFAQPVAVLFLGDGVLQLFPEQDGRALGAKNIARQLASLPLYDIDTVYVDAQAAARYNINLALSPVATEALEPRQIHALMSDVDHLLGL